MPLTRIEPGASLALSREQPVVCVPVFGGFEAYVQCIQSVFAHTPKDVPILVADDASSDERIVRLLEELDAKNVLDHDVHYLRQPQNVGFVANVNAAIGSTAPADLVILNSDCVVSAGWLEGLREAAYADSRTATASALTNHGTILSVPERNAPSPSLQQGLTIAEAARVVRERALRLRPEVPTALGHCFYVRRSALELVGDLDERFSPGYGEEVDFSQRCLLHGLKHVVADDVFVFHKGKVSFTDEATALQEEHEDVIAERYPYYHDAVHELASAETGTLARAIGVARRALCGLTVTIDGRILGPHLMGTQLVVLELVWALAQRRDVQLRVVVPRNLGDYAKELLDDLTGVELLAVDEVDTALRSDVAHRPYQASAPGDLELLSALGDRVVISHLDLIAYDNPGYFADFADWDRYRSLTREALSFADRVVFISATAAAEAQAAELIDDEHLAVVHPGTDHQLAALGRPPERPRGVDEAAEGFLLVLGTDYRHKNRLFALRLFAELRREHGWTGKLVLAGPRVPFGSSVPDEASFLAENPELAEDVSYLGAIGESEKSWLLERAGAVVYPSTYEGFGLVPFEAATSGVPCLFAPVTSLLEVLPAELARLVPWDAAASARNATGILDGDGRESLVSGLQKAAKAYTWAGTAEQTVAVYEDAIAAPSRPLRSRSLDIASVENRLELLEKRAERSEEQYAELVEAIGEDGLSLVGPNGVLPHDLRRPLLAIAVRPWLRGPILGTLRLPYRLMYRLRHRDGR